MVIRVKAILFSSLISLIGISSVAQPVTIKLRIKVPNANIRAEPELAAGIIAQVRQGTILVSDIKKGEWYKVALPGTAGAVVKYGYIHQSTVDVIEEMKEVPKQEKTDLKKEEVKKVKEIQKIEEKKEEQISDEVSWVIKKGKAKAPSREEANKEIPSTGIVHYRKLAPMGMGLSIGSNFANLSMDVEDEVQSIMGYCVGGSVTLRLSDFLEIEPEILFTTKRSKQFVNYSGSSYSYEIYWKSSVIEIPVLLRASIPVGQVFKPFIFLGPYSSIRIGGKKVVSTKYRGSILSEVEEGAGQKLFDFGFAFGAGSGFQIGEGPRLSLQLRFVYGLANIFDSEDSSLLHMNSIKTKNICLIFGFSI
jgi:hypothetical protein